MEYRKGKKESQETSDRKKRMLAPMQMELELAPDVDVMEFPCPYCNGTIMIEVDYGTPEEDSKG